jgi:replication factor A1
MSSLEDVIRKIRAEYPELTREVILQMMQKRREQAGRLLTEEGAAYMVANELGVSLLDGGVKTVLSLRNLTIGASDVSVNGKVLVTYPVQTFTKRNGALGKVGRLIIQDEASSVSVVLWDEKAELLEKGRIAPGMAVRINHGYVRAGLNGKPEVNVGQRGSIVQIMGEAPSGSAVFEPLRKIGSVNAEDIVVSFIGVVVEASPPSTFRRQDGSVGEVARLRIGDETGRISVVLWGEKAEAAGSFSKGDVLKVVNGRVRARPTGELEVHIDRFSDVLRLPSAPPGLDTRRVTLRKISELSPGMRSVDVLAKVISIGQIRVFDRPYGGQGRVGDLTLIDETGSIRLSLWDEKAELTRSLSPGDVLLLEGAYTKEGLGGQLSLHLGRLGRLTVNPPLKEADDLPHYQDLTPIRRLRDGLQASVEGVVIDEPLTREVTTRDGRSLTIASFRLKDDTGDVRVSLWRENAEKAKEIHVGTRLRITGAFVKTAPDGEFELSTRSGTRLEILPNQSGVLK